ncbi:Gldg family protein [Sphingobacterium faecale]|uniref:Gldg family protein n=1 Tax=Sphingobacterium faecale TaxID=2803775 RepID=A0ABS1R796_9SPHI|nr:Gldg family protein [Sphingobacterium faecale]MBL1410584.1 Gldg family protein [Sphingobacterium faecale]
MKTILRIARVELSTLFYSPIAWFLLIIFFVQISIAYLGLIESNITVQELGTKQRDFTYLLFADQRRGGLFISTVLQNIYLYIPLITMGLISREMQTGTIKLLYSSPVKLSSILLGKQLAMLAFSLCMLFLLAIIVCFACFHIENIDLGLIFSGFFALFLLLSAYSAIGLFMSCLTSYQVVAALSTFAVFAFLRYIGTVWQDYDFLRNITGYLSIGNRTELMISGLITSRDIIYYVLITIMFLMFAWLKLNGKRKSQKAIISLGQHSAVIVGVLIIGYVTSSVSHIVFFDASRPNRNTISVDTQKRLKDLGEEPLKVTMYVNLLDNTYFSGMPRYRALDVRRWEAFRRFKSNIEVDYVYYYDKVNNPALYTGNPNATFEETAQNRAKILKTDLSKFLKPDEIQKIVDLAPEKNRLVMLLEYKGKKEFLRTFEDMMIWPSEIELAAVLNSLTDGAPRIAFLQGQEERSVDNLDERGYHLATKALNDRASLINQGFKIENLDLSGQEIPAGLAALVVADPRADFSPTVVSKIEQYMDQGGNILFAGEPGKQSVLNPILKRIGVQMIEGTLVEQDEKLSADQVKSYITNKGLEFGKSISSLYKRQVPIMTRGVVGLTYEQYTDFDVSPLLETKADASWNKKGIVVLDSARLIYNPQEGDELKSYPTALAITRNMKDREQRILVIGDADFMSNGELEKSSSLVGNTEFYKGFIGWFTYGKLPIEVTMQKPIDDKINLSGSQIGPLKWIFLGLIPGMMALIGTILLIRRKRK